LLPAVANGGQPRIVTAGAQSPVRLFEVR